MNLIEKLGGYEKAKAIFKNKPKYAQGWWSGVYYKQGEWCWWWSEYLKKWLQHEKHIGNSTKYTHSIKMKDIQQALLEHRRQYNIFEVGDAVIRKWNGRLYYLIVDIDNDGQEFLIHHDNGAKFKDCRIFDNICNFKHATDEEIKAGRRL